MKNTIEEKQRYFMSHWGQKLIKLNFGNYSLRNVNFNNTTKKQVETSYLELAPLSMISDEHGIEVARIIFPDENHWDIKNIIGLNAKALISKRDEDISIMFVGNLFETSGYTLNTETFYSRILKAFDFLRKNSYAIEFDGTLVETLISWGWCKLKTK